jgi:hypothetical protein
MQSDQTMTFFASRKKLKNSPAPIWYINRAISINENPALAIDWTNNGPVSTHVIGLGIGSPALWWVAQDIEAEVLYRDWLKIQRVTNIHQPPRGLTSSAALGNMLDQIKQKTWGLNYINPQKDAKVTLDPALLDIQVPINGFQNQVGNTVNITWDFEPFHKISAYYWITQQNYTTDSAGEYRLELGLQQIYQ